ncbi:MAG: N-acetyltransferase family protein [Pseudobdellovibrionaceae bacterium]|jgi:RimJ/RimL family protein N-acetyltransferase
MAEFLGKRFVSKSGSTILVRSATEADASHILSLAKSVIGEEIYQLTSASEFRMTVDDEEKWIRNHLENPNHLLLVATLNNEVIGMLDFSNGHRQRIAHTGEFGMSVAKDFRGQGIGSFLLSSLFEWAKSNRNLEKINLSVHGNNERAVALYKKMGFEVEGVRKKDLNYGDGKYIDTVLMGKFL